MSVDWKAQCFFCGWPCLDDTCRPDKNDVRHVETIRGLGGPVVRTLAARAKGPGFDSSIIQHVQRLISRVFTYGGAVGSPILSWSWTRQPGFHQVSLDLIV